MVWLVYNYFANNVLKSFISFCKSNNWDLKKETTLLAVSGGVDSMAMLDLFVHAKYPVAVAHINFGLRGNESNLDEQLVRKVCEKHNIPVHVFSPDTMDFAKKNHVSVQMAARQLRYDFFNELCETFGYTKLATAHHSDDNLEHFFIYLLRNSLKTALKGIPVQNNRIIRPLLGFTRNQILDYANSENIEWRNDASNDSVKYLRNKVRHLLIPQLKEVYPEMVDDFNALSSGMHDFYERQQSVDNEELKTCILKQESEIIEFSKKVTGLADGERKFAEYAQKLGFEIRAAQKMLSATTGAELKAVHSDWHMQILNDRIRFVCRTPTENRIELNIEEIHSGCEIDVGQFRAELSWQKGILENEADAWYFDLGKTTGELIFRQAIVGEKMSIWGLQGHKKISDVYTNAKIGRFDRYKYPVMEFNGKILGVLGVRRSAEMPVVEGNKQLLKLKWHMLSHVL